MDQKVEPRGSGRTRDQWNKKRMRSNEGNFEMLRPILFIEKVTNLMIMLHNLVLYNLV